jgi:hypothetical protein
VARPVAVDGCARRAQLAFGSRFALEGGMSHPPINKRRGQPHGQDRSGRPVRRGRSSVACRLGTRARFVPG